MILALVAFDYIDSITFNRLKEEPLLITDEVKKATCSVMEEMHRQNEVRNKGVVKSFSNDGYSETLSYGSDLRSNARKLREAASLYLAHTGLLYRGIRYAGSR